MLNERQDKFAGWAGKLEEPGALSGHGLADKDASWEKLHARLRPGGPKTQTQAQMQAQARKRKRALPWFWLSAAALLIIIIGIALFKTTPVPPGSKPAPATPAATPSSELVRIIPNTPVAFPPANSVVLPQTRTAIPHQPITFWRPLSKNTPETTGLVARTAPTHQATVNSGANPLAVSSGITGPIIAGPLTGNPGITSPVTAGSMTISPRISGPGTSSPMTASPGIASPGTSSSASGNPGITSPITAVPGTSGSGIPDPITTNPAGSTSPANTVIDGSALPVKKDLRIVSINEIADTLPAPTPAMAQKQLRQHKSYPFTIGLGSAPIRPAMATHSNPETKLKFSLSSQNP